MRYLFWNTHKNSEINSFLCSLIIENNISIIVLAEYTADVNNLIQLLSNHGLLMKQYPTVGCERIDILGKTDLNIEPGLQTDYTSIQIINNSIILCCLHLISKISPDHAEKRKILVAQIINDILDAENKLGTHNTIVVGDFNINPYDQSCISASYFHGIPIYEESKRESRTILGKEFYMFYNPMWNFLGDFKKPCGTYYYNSGDVENTYWNIYDQVLIRPSLRRHFVDDSLKILTSIKDVSLLDKNEHPDRTISDHLPIMFEIKENYYEQKT